jgi:hypothetical protein
MIVSIKTVTSKRNTKYEIRKEHVTYSDGKTEDRVRCYDFTGRPLGTIAEAERFFISKKRNAFAPPVGRAKR